MHLILNDRSGLLQQDNLTVFSSSCVESKYGLIIITAEPVQVLPVTLAQCQVLPFRPQQCTCVCLLGLEGL